MTSISGLLILGWIVTFSFVIPMVADYIIEPEKESDRMARILPGLGFLFSLLLFAIWTVLIPYLGQ